MEQAMPVVDSMGRSSAPATSSEWLSIGELSRRFKVHVNTARNAANAGRLRSYRLNAASFDGKSHRRFLLSDVHEWLGLTAVEQGSMCASESSKPKVVLCARVSSSGQKEDLARQVKRLEDYAELRWGKDGATIHKYVRIASGLTYNAPGLLTLVSDILNGKLSNAFLVITHRDRLIRFGFNLLKAICETKGIQIVQIESEEPKSLIDELVADILSLSQVANMSIYGQRGNKNRITFREVPQSTVDRILAMRNSGLSLREIQKQLEKAGANVDASGKCFGLQVVRRILANAKAVNDNSLAKPQRGGGSFDTFLRAKLKVGGPGAKITRAKILAAYSAHCEATGQRRVSRKLCLEQLSQHVQKLNVSVTENGDSVLYTGLNLVPHSVTTAKAT
jgi:putative resolvase